MKDLPTYDFSADFQLGLLAVLFTDSMFVASYRGVLNPHYFEDEYHRTMARMILDHYDQFGTLPSQETAKEMLSRDQGISDVVIDDYFLLLHKLYHKSTANLEYLREEVVEFGREQRMRNTILKAATMIEAEGFKASRDKVTMLFQDALASDTGADEDVVDPVSGLDTLAERLLERESPDSPLGWVRTGIGSLDRKIKGVGVGHLMFIIAMPGVGKSNLLFNMLRAAYLQGKHVLLVANELQTLDVEARFGSLMTGIHRDDLAHSADQLKEYYEMYSSPATKSTMGSIDIVYAPAYAMDVLALQSLIIRRQAMTGKKYDVLGLDAFYRMKGIDPLTGWEGGGKVCKELINMLKHLELRGITTDQPVKDVEPGQPIHYAMMGGSAAKFQDADVVMSLSQTENEREDHQATLYVSKGRHGGEETYHRVVYDRQGSLLIMDANDPAVDRLNLVDQGSPHHSLDVAANFSR